MSQNPGDDRLLEEFLARRSAVAREYRDAASEQPSADIDHAIRAAARRTVGSRPYRAGWTRRWTAPLAAAAVIVLAVAITLTLEREPRYARVGGPLEPEQQKATTSNEISPAPADQLAATAPVARDEARSRSGAERRIAPARAPSVQGDAADMLGSRQRRADMAASEPRAKESAVAEAPPMPATPAPVLKQREQVAVEDKAKPAEAVDAPAAAAIGEAAVVRQEAVEASKATSELAAGVAPGKKTELSRDQWIEKIQRLLDAGRIDEAKAALAEFRKFHPEAKLPEKLRTLEPQK